MAIVTMTSRQQFEANHQDPNYWIEPHYHGAEAGLTRHSPACPHYAAASLHGVRGQEIGPGYADCVGYGDPRREEVTEVNTGVYGTGNGGKVGYLAGTCSGPMEPLYMHRSHVGLVLDADGEENGRDDSDFYALVWDEEKAAPVKVTYASTRGWTYPNHAQADATPEVQAKYAAWVKSVEDARRARAAALEAATPREGKTVKVVKGRKVPVGTQGTVVWYGPGRYGGMRVGILACGVKHWTDAGNVQVVQVAP